VARSVQAQGWARRRLLLRPRPGSGEDAIPPEAEAEAESWGGRGGDLLPRPRPNVGCCQPCLGGWHSSQSGVSGAVFLSDRSVKGRSDCGHFDLAD
jgi:hypothetical protein